MAKTYTLKEPITYKGLDIVELVFKSLKVKHLEAMDKHAGDTGKTIALIASLTGVTENAIRELSVEDFVAAQKIASEDLGKFQATGDE